MAKKNKIYVTTMYRWGSKENHSYIIYVGASKSKAIDSGQVEQLNRGNKYEPETLEFYIGEVGTGKLVSEN